MAGSQIAGRTVVITGAASGIGRALAFGFLADGAKVIAADVNEAGLADVVAAGATPARVDVTVEADVQHMIRHAVETTGRVDVLFNNAGIGGASRIERIADGIFERFIAVHLFGGFYGYRAVLPVMRAQNYGRIITLSGRAAELREKGWAAYGCAKAGLHTLARVAAAETAGTNILVNTLLPGQTSTGMMKGDGLQQPDAVYPWALELATLPAGGPTGKVFMHGKEYHLFGDAET